MQDSNTPGELRKRRLAANWLDLELSTEADGKSETERVIREFGVPESFKLRIDSLHEGAPGALNER